MRLLVETTQLSGDQVTSPFGLTGRQIPWRILPSLPLPPDLPPLHAVVRPGSGGGGGREPPRRRVVGFGPRYVILLALFNDVTMIPVAEDRQTAAAEPQHASWSSFGGTGPWCAARGFQHIAAVGGMWMPRWFRLSVDPGSCRLN